MAKGELYELSCEIKAETDKAVLLLDYATGKELWVPLSQVDRLTRYPDGTAVVFMTAWIAKQKGLI